MFEVVGVSYKFIFLLIIIGLPILLLIFLFIVVKGKKKTGSIGNNKAPVVPTVDRASVLKEKGAHYVEERRKILTMVDNGTISASEADRLLNTLERETSTMDCFFCGGEIRIESKKCKHCGEFFKDEPIGTKRLSKSRDQVFSGVCGGVAEYLDMDPFIIRLLTVIVALGTGIFTPLIVYLIAALIMPDAE